MNQHPELERIEPSYGNSFALRKFESGIKENIAPKWHFHPEIELVFIENGSGKRHIGNHISQYSNGDLIMVGPNLPHFGFTDRFSGTKTKSLFNSEKTLWATAFFPKD